MNSSLKILVAILLVVGGGISAYKYWGLNVPTHPTDDVIHWRIEAKLGFNTLGRPVTAQMSIAEQQPYYQIDRENYVSANFGIVTQTIGNSRFAVWTSPAIRGQQTLYYRASLTPVDTKSVFYDYKNADGVTYPEVEKVAAAALLQRAKAKASDTASLVSHEIKMFNDVDDQDASVLLNNNFERQNLVKALAKHLQYNNVTAFVVEGIRLNAARDPMRFVPWLGVNIDKKTRFFNPVSGEEELPKDFFVWHVGNTAMYHVQGGRNIRFAVDRSQHATATPTKLSDSKLLEFSLDTLPLKTQAIYKILLTIPLGALIILLFRSYVGTPTFGTFMPVLIGLAFLEMDLIWGVSLFAIIVSFGLAVRFYLERLHLLLVTRLSAVLVCVVLFIAFLSVIMNKLGLEMGASSALFPLVILTMTIEKMCNLWDERGPSSAIQTGTGSLFVAVLAYSVMRLPSLQFLLFHYPELNLVVLAAIIVLGQYRGYRLTELRRFRVLAERVQA